MAIGYLIRQESSEKSQKNTDRSYYDEALLLRGL